MYLSGFLSVNLEMLSDGADIVVPTLVDKPGWATIKVEDLKPEPDGKHIRLVCRVVWGPFFNQPVTKIVDPYGVALQVLYRRCGVTSRRRRHAVPRDIVGMLIFANLKTNKDILSFWEVHVSPQMLRLNQKLCRERRKRCLKGYNHPCNLCAVGLNECPRAVRPISLSVKGKPHDAVPIQA